MEKALKIAIIGYGKMGKEVEKLAHAQEMIIQTVIDKEEDWEKHVDKLKLADVAVEFTSPGVVLSNLEKLFDMGIPVVTGTTGWHKNLDAVKQNCLRCNGTLFYASNFSIGVNIFFALNRKLAALMAAYPEFSIALEEAHHLQKLDAPSGTAISLLDDILMENPGYEGWSLLPEKPGASEIPVTAIREAGVTGIHKVKYESDIDMIEISHTAKNREGFARGALMAAQWVVGRKGIYTMKDLLNI
jgi:4-hydroxy-tetrahydrodipicolinate reductase